MFRTFRAGACPAPTHITAKKLKPFVIDAMLRVLRNRQRAPIAQLAAAEPKADTAAIAFARYRDNDPSSP